MNLYDMHMHSTFSFDSSMEMEKAADRAIEIGLSGIAFTDHLDVNYLSDGSDVYYDFGEYLYECGEVREKYKGRLDVIRAVEIGLQPHVVDENIRRLSGYSFDYRIGSIHLISRTDPYDGSYFKAEPEKNHAYRRYLQEVIKNVNLFHDFEALGHFDYIVRYADFPDNVMYYDDYSEEYEEILALMIKFGLAFEVNTRSYDKTPMDTKVLKRYRELGGETVVIGSDAHNYGRIGINFASAIELIKYCGFKYVAHFSSMKPVYDTV